MADSRIEIKKKTKFRQRLLIVLLASLPLLMAILLVVWMVRDLITEMQKNEVIAVQTIALQARKDELKHFVQAGSKVMAHYCSAGNSPTRLSVEGKELLRHMDFGDKTDDNYFFVYTMEGVNVMHPRMPEIEGTSLWDFKDAKGNYIIQTLVDAARKHDHFVNYVWRRPSTSKIEPKLGYVEYVSECNLMIGTGLYLDYMRAIEVEIEKQTKQTIDDTRDRIILIALLSLLVVAAGGLSLNLHETRKANLQLIALTEKIVRTQEEERTRVARELHDGVSQSLAATKFTFETAHLYLERGKIEDSERNLDAGVKKLQEVMREVRKMSHQLHPAILDDAGLGATLQQEGRELGERTGMIVSVRVGEISSLRRELKTDLYRVFQVALRNVELHSRAKHVDITIETDRAGLWMRIQDDGVGAPSPVGRRGDGLGLISMRERIETHGGEFEFYSEPGATQVTAFIPKNFL